MTVNLHGITEVKYTQSYPVGGNVKARQNMKEELRKYYGDIRYYTSDKGAIGRAGIVRQASRDRRPFGIGIRAINRAFISCNRFRAKVRKARHKFLAGTTTREGIELGLVVFMAMSAVFTAYQVTA